MYRDAADCVFIFNLSLYCFLRLGAFKTKCDFLAALADHLGFESLSQVLRGPAQIFYKPLCQILSVRSSKGYVSSGVRWVWSGWYIFWWQDLEITQPWRAPLRTDSTRTPDLDRKDLPNIENLLVKSYESHFSFIFNDLSESWPCGL